MKNKIILFTIFIFLAMSNSIFAQILDDEGPEPPPQASIGQLMPILLIAGLVFAFKKIKSLQI